MVHQFIAQTTINIYLSKGQGNDALEGLRESLGNKSTLMIEKINGLIEKGI